MSKTQRTNEPLWTKIVDKIRNGNRGADVGKWSARKAQLAVLEYKSKGGTYIGKKSPNNSLVKWTKEGWGYIDEKKGNRYLPKKIRQVLSPLQKRIENKAKKSATKKGSQRAKYSPEVRKLMRKLKIF